MKNKKTKIFAYLLLVSMLTTGKAQQVVNTLGGNASGSSGSVSYSIGQLVFNSISGSSGTVTQGVQQPYEVSSLGLEDNNNFTQNIIIYPNPTTAFLNLKLNNDTNELSYQIFDITGKLLKNETAITQENKIDISSFLPAIYLLKVFQNDNEFKTFKIIKN